MKALSACICLGIVVSAPWLANADDRVLRGSSSSSLERFVNGVINESVNANTLFASQEAISTGHYTQRRGGDPDKDYMTFRLPWEKLLGATSDTVRPYINGNGALLRTTAGVSPENGIGEDDFTVTSLFALSGGAGVSFRVRDSLSLVPSLSLAYSHIHNKYDFNNPFSQTFLAEYERDLFNWSMDLFTYTPALKVYYHGELDFLVWNYHLGYTYLFNDSIHSDSAVLDIKSSTGLLTNRIDFPISLSFSLAGAPLYLRPMFQWNNISGSAVKGLGLRDLFEVGADLVAQVLEPGSWLDTIVVGASYVSGKDFEGYHLGLGATF